MPGDTDADRDADAEDDEPFMQATHRALCAHGFADVTAMRERAVGYVRDLLAAEVTIDRSVGLDEGATTAAHGRKRDCDRDRDRDQGRVAE